MPQTALGAYVAKNTLNQLAPLNLDGEGALTVSGSSAVSSALNITAAVVVKAAKGSLVTVVVNTAGSAAGSAHDVATTGGASAANLIFSIPNTVGAYELNWPCAVGIVVVPGTSQVLAVSYS